MFAIVGEIIEIREDAYKQNDVYRPWPKEDSHRTVSEILLTESPHYIGYELDSTDGESQNH